MDTAPLKSYAPAARREFLQAVADRAAHYGLTAKKIEPVTVQGDVALIAGEAFPARIAPLRKALEERIARDGFDVTIEAIAYTWFNRLVALRYMELAGYLDHGLRVLSHPAGDVQPEILQQAARLDLPGLDKQQVIDLKLDGTKQEELYRLLLVAQCNALSAAMPFLFERINDATELLLPANLLASDSVVRTLVEAIPEALWADIEIIGWLYQFYIAEKKDEVIGKVVKSEDIPAATQLFTPNWIVKYMVQNSLGATWLATYPTSPLKSQMEFYIEPAEQTPEVQAQLAAITPASLDPEALTLIDPASGSGHILVEAYDLFKAIYLERGYRQRDIPELILTKNLFGLDICPRAAQLTGFALMMKGRADDRNLFSRGIELNVMPLTDSSGFDIVRLASDPIFSQHSLELSDVEDLVDLFADARTFGSLIRVPPALVEKLPALAQLSAAKSEDLFTSHFLASLKPIVRQAQLLSQHYDAVVANPPYMGPKGHNPKLKTFAADNYSDAKNDLYAMFVQRGFQLAKPAGHQSVVTMHSWMFLSSYEDFRETLLRQRSLRCLAHLDNGVMGIAFGTAAAVWRPCFIPEYRTSFCFVANNDLTTRNAPDAFPPQNSRQVERRVADVTHIPGSPLAYWAPSQLLEAWRGDLLKSFTVSDGQNKTADNERFVRFLWEVSIDDVGQESRWRPYAKGGPFRRWYGNIEHAIDWSPEARSHYRSDSRCRLIPEYLWNRAGITWSRVGSGRPSFRLLPRDATFDMVGSSVFTNDEGDIPWILAILNSSIAEFALGLLNPTVDVQISDVRNIPVPTQCLNIHELAATAKRLIDIHERDWNSEEPSLGYAQSPIAQVREESFGKALEAVMANRTASEEEVIALQAEVDQRVCDAYGVVEGGSLREILQPVDSTLRQISREEHAKRFLSYAIGCIMGRYSLDAPGIIFAHSDPRRFRSEAYQTFAADADGIVPLTAQQWFSDDAASRIESFLATLWPADDRGESLAALAACLSPKVGEAPRETLRRYLAVDFYPHHLAVFRKRPIYWLFQSGRMRAFQCLAYAHRMSEGTLSRIYVDYVATLLARMGAQIGALEEAAGKTTSATRRRASERELRSLITQRKEVSEYAVRLRHFADTSRCLCLNDGIAKNYDLFGELLAER